MSSPEPVEGQQAAVPTCYRHPDRETYVRCTRCDRYICPECMRDAAVGHQCVECVREGAKTVRQPRTAALGNRADDRPVVTYVLLAINIAVFVVQYMLTSDSTKIERDYSMVPLFVADGDYFRLLTSTFLHAGLAHVLFNMWALYVVGQPLEAWLGRVRFTVLYLLSALGGSVFIYLFAQPNSASVGASGAVFGLFGAIFIVARRMNFDVRGIAMLIGLNLVLTFAFAGISWQAHIGGLITGAAVALGYAYAPAKNRTAIQIATSVGAAALFVALIALRTSDLTSPIVPG